MIDGCGEEASLLDGERCEVLIVVVGSHSFRLSLVLFSSESVNGVFKCCHRDKLSEDRLSPSLSYSLVKGLSEPRNRLLWLVHRHFDVAIPEHVELTTHLINLLEKKSGDFC